MLTLHRNQNMIEKVWFHGVSLLIAISFLAVSVKTIWAQDEQTTARMLQLITQAQDYEAAGELEKATIITKSLVKLQRRYLPDSASDLADSLIFLGQIQTQAGDGEGAEKSLKESLQLHVEYLGEKDWRTVDVRLMLEEVTVWQKLTEEQRDQLNELTVLQELSVTKYESSDFSGAVKAANEVIDIQKEIFGINNPQVAYSINQLGLMYHYQGDYPQAQKLYDQSTAISLTVFGQFHPQYAECLNNQAGLYETTGKHQKSIPLFKQALSIYEETTGSNDPAWIGTMDNLAGAYAAMSDYENAEKIYLKCYKSAQKFLSKEDPLYSRILGNLAVHYHDVGKYSLSLKMHQESLKLTSQIYGKQHPAYAICLNNIGKHYQQLGDYQQARNYLLQSLKITQDYYGKTHPDSLTTQNNLAQIATLEGEYQTAILIYLEVIDSRFQILGTDHPAYAISLDGLASVYELSGDYVSADQLFQESMEIRKRVLGVRHQDYAQSLNNIAGNYSSMGDYTKAEAFYLQSLDITKEIMGEQHIDYATALNNLAVWFGSIGEYEKALPLFNKAIEISRIVNGEQHPSHAYLLKQLGILHLEALDLEKAKPLLLQVLNVEQTTYKGQHPEIIKSLISLSVIAFRSGDSDEGKMLIQRALKMAEETMENSNPLMLGIYNTLGSAYFVQGKYAEAEAQFLHALHGNRELLETTASVQSERQQLSMAEGLRYQLDVYLSMAAPLEQYHTNAYREVLAWKGATLVRQMQIRKVFNDKRVASYIRELQDTSLQLATLTRVKPEPSLSDSWKVQIAELTAVKENLEAELSSKSAEFRLAQKQISLEDLQSTLPDQAVLIDFLEFGQVNPEHPNEPPVLHLLAFVISGDHEVKLKNLGPVTPVSDAIDIWRNSFGVSKAGVTAGQELRRRLWEPLESELNNAKLILVSVDGVLGRLPITALPGKEPASYLIEDHRVAMLPVPKLLPELIDEMGRERIKSSLLLMGDVDYDSNTNTISELSELNTSRGSTKNAIRGGEVKFSHLAGTEREIQTIQKTYNRLFDSQGSEIQILQKATATEQQFRQLAGQFTILHLATHGFFADPSKRSVFRDNSTHSESGLSIEIPSQIRGFNSGLLSGLVFSGANLPPQLGKDDGILTADEIAAMSLGEVNLVVLSACETGLGAVAGGEGLLGVQRAFQVAGADTTIASFWQVGDVATMLLMERFYWNLWERKMSKLDALREAQLYLLNNPKVVLDHKDIRGDLRISTKPDTKITHRLSPQFWAAFSLSGAWK